MALSHPPIVHPAHALPASHPQQVLMQQPGQPGPSGMPMQMAQYGQPYVGVGVRPPQPGMTAMAMAQQQAAVQLQQQQQRQLQLSQQQQHQQLAAQQQQAAASAALAAAQQQQAAAQAAVQQQQQAAAAAAQQRAAMAAQAATAGHHMSPSPHLQHQGFPVSGPAGAVHPHQYAGHPSQAAALAMAGPRPAGVQMRPPRPGQVRPPQQSGMVQQHTFQQHPGIQQPGQQQGQQPGQQQPGQGQHPSHVAGQVSVAHGQTPQPQGTPVLAGAHVHPPQASMEHQMSAQGYDMSRVGSGVQSQISQVRDAESLLRPYIYDYLLKHELTSTAATLRNEGGLGEQTTVPIQLPKGLLSELWGVFWDLVTAGKGPQAFNSPAAYNETLTRLRTMRQQIAAGGAQQQQGQFQGGAASTVAQRIPTQQFLDIRSQTQQQQAIQQATQSQAHMMQQQQLQAQQQQQAAQAQAQAQQATLLQQQQAAQQQAVAAAQQQQAARFGQQASAAGSPAQQHRPPPGQQHVYTPQQQHIQMQPPGSQGAPNHPSPMAPSPRMTPQQHKVMPSPHQQHMRPPPGINGVGIMTPVGTPPQMMSGVTQQQPTAAIGMTPQGSGTYMHPATPQAAASPAPPTPQQQPMTVHQQQLMHAQAQVIQARAHQLQQENAQQLQQQQQQQQAVQQAATAAQQQQQQAQQQQQQHAQQQAMLQQQAQQQQAQQQAQQQGHQGQGQSQQQLQQNGPMTPQQVAHYQQQHAQQQQQQQQQQHQAGQQPGQQGQPGQQQPGQPPNANQAYSNWGLGQVNPTVMNQTVHSLGFGGRDMNDLSEDEKARLTRTYRAAMADAQRRQMLLNGVSAPQQGAPGVSPAGSTPQQQFPPHVMMQQQQAQQNQQAGNQQGRQVSGQSRAHGVAFGGSASSTPMQAESSTSNARDNTPPERKRQRRDSGSAAPSPYVQPQNMPPGGFPQQGGMMGQQMMAGGRPMSINGPAQTPTAMEAASPAHPAQSPRTQPINGVPGQAMQRNQSKSGHGDMPPPQSPAAATLGRTTPQAGKVNMTPKMQKDELIREATTPKSLKNSPSTSVANVSEPPQPGASQGVTPSPPSANTGGAGPGQNHGGPVLNGVVPDGSANATPNINVGNTTNLFPPGDILDNTNIFGADGELDWMNFTAGDGIDFTMYLENIGEDNDGEVGMA